MVCANVLVSLFWGNPACSCVYLVFAVCTCACIHMHAKHQIHQKFDWYLRSMHMYSHIHTLHFYVSATNDGPTIMDIAHARILVVTHKRCMYCINRFFIV
jgi:hypothetical protein